MTVKVTIVEWDWKEEPNWENIAGAVRNFSEDKVYLALADTRSETYALVIANGPLTLDDATELWREQQGDEDD